MRRKVTAAVVGVALTATIGIGVASAATGTDPRSYVSDALAGLVKEGTIDQEQADAVAEALADARERAQAERQEQRAERMGQVDTLLQETLGLSRSEVADQLREGKTLKEIAGDKADELAAGALALVRSGLDDAVAAGRLTQEQADRIFTRADERADAWLAGDDDLRGGLWMMLGMGGRGLHGGHGPGPWPGHAPGGDDSSATHSTSA